MNVAVVGVGLIGGSIGLAARERLGAHVVGFDPDGGVGSAALQRGAVERVAASVAEAVANAELVFVAAPVGALAETLDAVLEAAPADCAVSDVGSTKRTIVSGRTDPRFKDDISRGDNSAVISERMSRWCSERTSAAALDILGAAMIPAGPVLKPQQALDDPHVQAMKFFQRVDYPGLPSPAPLARAPLALSETPGTIAHRAPTLGEHTEAVLAEVGYSPDEISGLRSRAII